MTHEQQQDGLGGRARGTWTVSGVRAGFPAAEFQHSFADVSCGVSGVWDRPRERAVKRLYQSL